MARHPCNLADETLASLRSPQSFPPRPRDPHWPIFFYIHQLIIIIQKIYHKFLYEFLQQSIPGKMGYSLKDTRWLTYLLFFFFFYLDFLTNADDIYYWFDVVFYATYSPVLCLHTLVIHRWQNMDFSPWNYFSFMANFVLLCNSSRPLNRCWSTHYCTALIRSRPFMTIF